MIAQIPLGEEEIELIKSVALFILILASACASKKAEHKDPLPIQGPEVATITFEPGKSTLSKISQRELNKLAIKANQDGREIEKYQVLSWSDKEYPLGDKGLAKKRAKVVKKYLTNDMNAQEKIQIFNMAERPGVLGEALQSDEWALKTIFEKTGATAVSLPDGKMSYTKASKALVIINYKDDERL